MFLCLFCLLFCLRKACPNQSGVSNLSMYLRTVADVRDGVPDNIHDDGGDASMGPSRHTIRSNMDHRSRRTNLRSRIRNTMDRTIRHSTKDHTSLCTKGCTIRCNAMECMPRCSSTKDCNVCSNTMNYLCCKEYMDYTSSMDCHIPSHIRQQLR